MKQSTPPKILIIRFSSIGDIVLTTPVIRCLKQQLGAEVHYLCKKSYRSVLAANPYLDRIFTIEKKVSEVLPELKKEKYNYIIDLHNNLRSSLIKFSLHKKTFVFNKLNFQKWLIVKLGINRLPNRHIVDRYMDTLKPLGVINDHKGLDYFVGEGTGVRGQGSGVRGQGSRVRSEESGVRSQGPGARKEEGEPNNETIQPFNNETIQPFNNETIQPFNNEAINPFNHKAINHLGQQPYIAFAIGAAHQTKRLPEEKIIAICQKIKFPIVLLGGPGEQEEGERIAKAAGDHVINCCGVFSLNQSAVAVQQAWKVITHDTGMMHIAAAFHKDIISVWGNTIPEFGMAPYLPTAKGYNTTVEVKGLSCRPCSKIGYEACPKGHFDCMNKIEVAEIVEKLNAVERS